MEVVVVGVVVVVVVVVVATVLGVGKVKFSQGRLGVQVPVGGDGGVGSKFVPLETKHSTYAQLNPPTTSYVKHLPTSRTSQIELQLSSLNL